MKALGLIIPPTRTSGKLPMSPNDDEWLKGKSGEWAACFYRDRRSGSG